MIIINKKVQKIIIIIILLIFALIAFKTIKNQIEKVRLNVKLQERYDINLSLDYKIVTNKKNSDWHGQHQNFRLLQFKKSEDIENIVHQIGFIGEEIGLDYIRRIREIEDILNIEVENKIDFTEDYRYKVYIKSRGVQDWVEAKDYLYIIINNIDKGTHVFLIEDINPSDL